MKFIPVAVLLATVTAHLILAENPDSYPLKKEQNPSFLSNANEPVPDKKGYSISLPDIVESIKPFSKKRSKRKFKWNKGIFAKAVRNLGILNIPGLKLLKVKKAFIRELEKVKSHVITIPRQRRRRARGDSSIHKNTRPQKKTLHDLCEETVDSLYVLAHADERLAYSVETVRCVGSCYSATLRTTLGQCILKIQTMVVYVLNESNTLVPKTVEAGCACECLTNFT